MRRHIHIVIGLFAFLSWQQLSAQLVNDGAKIFISSNALLYVNHNVTHKGGEVVNNGEMIVTGNWVNDHPNSNVFSTSSSGIVKFTSKATSFSGSGTTIFPKLVFVGDGVFTMKTNIGAFLSIDLDDAELQTENNQLTLSNINPAAISFKNGFVSTGSAGLFIRSLRDNDDYVYPLGSRKLGIKRFVVLRPKQAGQQSIGAAFIDKDPNLDGYSRSQNANGIVEVNDSFYHILKRNDGGAAVDASFYTTATEKFTSLINWTNKNIWEKALPTTFQDNVAITNGLNKSFLHQSVNLPLGMLVPFAFAKVSAVNTIELFNAFSPDGDGKNDTWEIKNIDLFPDNDLKIYDRSGNLIFRANGYNSAKYWDGKNGTSGTYIYILRVKIDGKDQFFKGAITMVKN